MPRPGVTVPIESRAAPGGPPTDIATLFAIVEAERGPVDTPVLIRSLDDRDRLLGGRGQYANGYDSLEAHIREGRGAVWLLRLVGTGAQSATVDGGGVTFTASSPGEWGNDLEVELASAAEVTALGIQPASLPQLTLAPAPAKAPARKPKTTAADAAEKQTRANGDGNGDGDGTDAEPMGLAVRFGGEVVERALALTDADSLVAWSEDSDYIRVTAPAGAQLTAGVFTLIGGADGPSVVDDPQALLSTALRFDEGLGPGQLAAWGKTDPAQHEALMLAAEQTNRQAILDTAFTDIPGVIAHARLLRKLSCAAFGGLWFQRAIVPGLAVGSQRTVPWSAVQTGVIARVDRETGNPNQAAAGEVAACRWATGIIPQVTVTDIETLMYEGVNSVRMIDSIPRNYGYRTLVDPAGPQREWLFLNNRRFVMKIKAEAQAIGERMVFRDTTWGNISTLAGALAGMLGNYWDENGGGPLVGATEEDAYRVLTEDPVNTVETMAAGEIRALIALHIAGPAEWIYIPIVKYALSVPLT